MGRPRTVGRGGDHGGKLRESGQCRKTSRMADGAIAIDTGQRISAARIVIGDLVFVFMVSQMLRGSAGFMPTVTGHRGPGELERQKNQEKNGKPASHPADVSRNLPNEKLLNAHNTTSFIGGLRAWNLPEIHASSGKFFFNSFKRR